MPPVDPTLESLLLPLTENPKQAAVLLDVDGVLAPIVRHADDAHVPETTRAPLIAITRRYGLVACISGRRAAVARRIVALGTITYVGNHGAEILRGGSTEPQLADELARYRDRVKRFAARELRNEQLPTVRLRGEDKDAIYAFHWRGVPDREGAERLAQQIAIRAENEGLATHWGRRVLEIRPPVDFNKGTGVKMLLAEHPTPRTAIYVGDDRTDLDAWRALRAARDDGRLDTVACVGVRSDETPPELVAEADLLVDGTQGVAALIQRLAEA